MSVTSNKPSVRLSNVLESTKRISKLVGINVTTPQFEYRPLTYLTCILCVFFAFFTSYTVIREALTTADWKNCLKYCVVVGSGTQCLSRLLTAFVHHHALRDTSIFCTQQYMHFEKYSPEHERLLGKCVDTLERVIHLIRVGYFVIFVAMSSLPLILIAIDGPRYLVLQYRIPGIDPETEMGYWMTNGVHMTTVVMGGCGLYVGDLYVIIFFTQARLYSTVFQLRVANINALLDEQDNHIHVDNEATITGELHTLVTWHQDYMNYTNRINDIFYQLISTQVLTSAFSMTVSIFVMLTSPSTSSWPMGYFYLPLTYYSLIVYCILGTQIEKDNDDIFYETTNIWWYRMTVPQRKTVRMLIMAAQHPKTFKILSVIPLTVSTALEMTKSIYSLSMMISNTDHSN